jgi:hypothetical protein
VPESCARRFAEPLVRVARIGLGEAEALAQVRERYGEPLDALTEEQLTEAIRALAEEFNRRNARPVSERKQSKGA